MLTSNTKSSEFNPPATRTRPSFRILAVWCNLGTLIKKGTGENEPEAVSKISALSAAETEITRVIELVETLIAAEATGQPAPDGTGAEPDANT